MGHKLDEDGSIREEKNWDAAEVDGNTCEVAVNDQQRRRNDAGADRIIVSRNYCPYYLWWCWRCLGEMDYALTTNRGSICEEDILMEWKVLSSVVDVEL
jgi:hypothetical protein